MYHPEYGKALTALEGVHERYRLTIDPNVQDVRLAIYYLSGGSITQANLALRAWAHGDLNTPMRAKRFIDECKVLILCLIAIQSRDRFVRRFFKDEIVTINPRDYKKEIMAATGLSNEDFDEWVEVHKTINHGFSKGVHPNLTSVAYNSDIDTGKFNYDLSELAYHQIPGFDFANFIIIPAMDSVMLPCEAFGVSRADFPEIEEMREQIQQMAVAGHRARTGKKPNV